MNVVALYLGRRSLRILSALGITLAFYVFLVLMIHSGMPEGTGGNVLLGAGIAIGLWILLVALDIGLDTLLPSFYAQLRRETAAFFTTPIPYFVLFLFAVLSGVLFWGGLKATQLMTMRGVFSYVSFFGWFLFPLLTMGLFSRERSEGTIETLMTAPISDAAVTIAKYLAAISFYLVMLLPSVIYFMILTAIGEEIGKPDPGPVFSAYIGMVLTGSFFIAMGLFCSAITGSQILAALLCWVLIILFMISAGLAEMLSLTGTWLGDALEYIEPNSQHLEPFFTGVIDPKNVLYFLSFIVFFLFLSVRSIETRKWR